MCLFITLLLICSFALGSHGALRNDLTMPMQHQMHIKNVAIRTFEIDNHIIDCINIYKQPSSQHPLLVNHTIQLRPNYPGEINDYICEPSPAWNTSNSCPEGSIPIERIQSNGHLTGNLSINHEYKHRRHYFLKQRGIQQNFDQYIHEHSVIDVKDGKFYGIKATLNVWNPKVDQKKNDATVSQVWIAGGHSQNTLEAGWQECPSVASIVGSPPPKCPEIGRSITSTQIGNCDRIEVIPELYDATETRFFTFWTTDGYNKTGCLNLQCPGFIQTNRHTMLNASLRPVSVYGGLQRAIEIEIFQDKTTKNWWLRLQGVDMGYWPKELFPVLLEGGDFASFGGEVIYQGGGAHTSTQMGSGHFAEEGFKKSSFIKNIKLLDATNVYVNARHVIGVVQAESCYDMQIGTNTDGPWGNFFFFGGPGRSEKCT